MLEPITMLEIDVIYYLFKGLNSVVVVFRQWCFIFVNSAFYD